MSLASNEPTLEQNLTEPLANPESTDGERLLNPEVVYQAAFQPNKNFALKLNAISRTPPSEQRLTGGGAIRVEKQASFNAMSGDDSSFSGGAQSSPAYEERLSDLYGATSAFAAAESKVRSSQIQMFNRNFDDLAVD